MKTYRNFLCLAIATLVLTPTFAVADSVMLYAAGSLNKALDLIASNYEKKYSAQIVSKFGPSGLLRKEIESGANVDVFASANMAHPEQLAASGWGSPVVLSEFLLLYNCMKLINKKYLRKYSTNKYTNKKCGYTWDLADGKVYILNEWP